MFNLHLLCTVRAMHPITSLNYDLRAAHNVRNAACSLQRRVG